MQCCWAIVMEWKYCAGRQAGHHLCGMCFMSVHCYLAGFKSATVQPKASVYSIPVQGQE